MANGNVAFLHHDKDSDTLTIRLPDAHVSGSRVSAIAEDLVYSFDETGGIIALSLGKSSQFDLDRWLSDAEHHRVPTMLLDDLVKWKRSNGEGLVQTKAALSISNVGLPQSSAELPPSDEHQRVEKKAPSHHDAQAVRDDRALTSQDTKAPATGKSAAVAPPDAKPEVTHAGNKDDHPGNIKHDASDPRESSRKKHEGKAGTG